MDLVPSLFTFTDYFLFWKKTQQILLKYYKALSEVFNFLLNVYSPQCSRHTKSCSSKKQMLSETGHYRQGRARESGGNEATEQINKQDKHEM